MALYGEKGPAGGNRTLWTFLVIGVILFVAGMYVPIPGASASLPKAEVLTGIILVIAAAFSLVVTR